MKTMKEIFEAMHARDTDLAHAFLRWLIDTYGREHELVRECYPK